MDSGGNMGKGRREKRMDKTGSIGKGTDPPRFYNMDTFSVSYAVCC